MLRRVLLATAAVAAVWAPSAQAAPPYCVAVTDGGGTLASSCVAGSTCLVGGSALPSSPLGFGYCIRWP